MKEFADGVAGPVSTPPSPTNLRTIPSRMQSWRA
jgi:hypothetical protein